jgi:hypothetical protein
MNHDRHLPRIPEPETLALQLAAGRTLLAAAIMAAPVPMLRVFGADTATAQRVVWLTRMTAARDGALGVGGLIAARRGGADATRWIAAGAVSDAVDAVVIASAVRQGRIKGLLPTAMAPLAALAAATGIGTAVRLRRR